MSSVLTRKALIGAVSDFLTTHETIQTTKGEVSGLPIIPEVDIAWENALFDPIGRELWASVFYVPNTPEGRTIGFEGADDLNGFVQIDLNVAPNTGDAALMAWEEKARIFFHAGRTFTHGGQSVLVLSCGMSQGQIVENFYRKSITIGFRSQLKRNKVG